MLSRLIILLIVCLPLAKSSTSVAEDHVSDIRKILDELEENPSVPTASTQSARVNRWLTHRSADARFEFLKQWSLPEDEDGTVRVVACDSVVTAPPKEFARVLGERPKENFFPIPQVAGVPGRFSSAHLLVAAAKDAVRIRELQQALNGRPGEQADRMRDLLEAKKRTAIPSIDNSTELNHDWLRLSGDPHWLTVEDHVAHAGTQSAKLIYRYPITNDFRMDVDELNPSAKRTFTIAYGALEMAEPFGYTGESYNRRSLIRSSTSLQGFINGHPTKTTGIATTSPWITIAAEPGKRITRNMGLSDGIKIPNEVEVYRDDCRDGWTVRNVQQTPPTKVVEQSWSYVRPLLVGETFQYEFFLSDASPVVHPTLGRLAMLLQDDGVNLHWITDGVNDWTGLPPNNSIADPLNRRGPKQLPLKNDDWNRVEIKRLDARILLSLNGILIYERAQTPADLCQFGWVQSMIESPLMVRSVTLRGEWPSQITTSGITRAIEAPDRLFAVDQDVIPDSMLESNIGKTLESAAKLPIEDRYRFLKAWVLPNERRRHFRLRGFFSESDDEDRFDTKTVSAATDLVGLAVATGKLSELLRQVKSARSNDEYFNRCRISMLALIEFELGHVDAVMSSLNELIQTNERLGQISIDSRWPDFLAARVGAKSELTQRAARDLLLSTNPKSAGDREPLSTWMHSLLTSLDVKMAPEIDKQPPIKLAHWHPTSRFWAKSCGQGRPPANWVAIPGQVQSARQHANDMLLYDVPLTGNFAIDCEVEVGEHTEPSILACGLQNQPRIWTSELLTGNVDFGFSKTTMVPAPTKAYGWTRQRVEVKDGTRTFYMGGHKFDERPVPNNAFPWLGLCNVWGRPCGFRDVRISGNPDIPAELDLATESLQGWLPYYFYKLSDPCGWSISKNGEIIGEKLGYTPGSGRESLVYYQRPIVEDATIDYEFFFREGEMAVHPALGHLAFMLTPKGIGLHHVTNGKFDVSSRDPLNLTNARESPHGQFDIGLLENQWNHMRVTIHGDKMQLLLNDTLVHEHKLAPFASRYFGLFHFADQTSARIRNIVYRGDWPRSLPAVLSQQLVDNRILELRRSAETLTSKFEHSFLSGRHSSNFFTLQNQGRVRPEHSPRGVLNRGSSDGNWDHSGISCKLRIVGDFDMTAEYQDLQFDGPGERSVMLKAVVGDDQREELSVVRFEHENVGSFASAQKQVQKAVGGKAFASTKQPSTATEGALRLCRRGEVMHMLSRDAGHAEFRYIGSYPVKAGPTLNGGIQLLATANRGGRSSVHWKSMQVRAEKILVGGFGTQLSRLYIMPSDGSGEVRQLTHDIESVVGNHRTPQFLPDDKRILFNTIQNSPTTAHSMIVDFDGSNVHDFGIGNEPSFSPDGKTMVLSSIFEGLMMMNTDGTNRRVVHPTGWSIQYSPDGKYLSFLDSGRLGQSQGANIYVMDVATETRTAILQGKHASRFSHIFWQDDWSPDSSEICFVGTNAQTGIRELAIVNAKGSIHGFESLVSAPGISTDVGWHPDGKRVLYSRNEEGKFGKKTLYVMDRTNKGVEILVQGQPRDHSIIGCEWSHDGKWIAFASEAPKVYQPK